MLSDFSVGLDIIAAIITLMYMGRLLIWGLVEGGFAEPNTDKRSLLNQTV